MMRTLGVLTLSACAAVALRAGDLDRYAFTTVKDVDYLGGGRTEKMDIYLPQGKPGERFPAILIVHGGGWRTGHRNDKREVQLGEVFAKAGFVAASIDYRMVTDTAGCWPQCIHDCKTAVRFLRANAAKYAIEKGAIGAIGGSAGGHLVMLLAFSGGKDALNPPGPYGEESTKIQAVVDLYGIPDIAVWGAGTLLKGVADREKAVVESSPVTYVDRASPPLLIMHGTADKTIDISQSDEFEKVLKARGARYAYRRVEGAPHTFLIESKVGDFRADVVTFFRTNLVVAAGTAK